MTLNRSIVVRTLLLISFLANLSILSSKTEADAGSCGGASIPLLFNDAPNTNIFL